ncbi:MAG: hypothetical protein J6Q67_01085 [Clostridia bacterium]|nr:hypothetical protein [Clostridia bacterium]
MRGYKKKVILIKNTGSDMFEEAFFVLKSDNKEENRQINLTRDMVYEANRVIDEKVVDDRKRKSAVILASLISFLSGALISVSVCTVLILCLR